MSAQQAAALLGPVDQIAVPIAAGQPTALLRALGERDDWRDLQVLGGLFLEPYDVFMRPGVRLLSGFFGPVERMLRAQGRPVDYLTSNFRGHARALRRLPPRVAAEAVSPMDGEGYFTFGVHAAATYTNFVAAGRDPGRVLILEANSNMPAVNGLPAFGGNRVHVSEVDAVIETDLPLPGIPDIPPTPEEKAIADRVVAHIDAGASLQFGIGGVPNEIARGLSIGEKGDFGIHTEMIPDGVMLLHEAGKVSNRKGLYDGLSIATFALGSQELYRWMDGNKDLCMLPVEQSNDPGVIRANRKMTAVNTGLAIDLYGQIVAEALGGTQYSGTGGHEDFVMGAHECPDGKSFVVMTSALKVDGRPRSRIVDRHPKGTIVTTPRYHLQWFVTEQGAVDLSLLSDAERAMAIARLAHPDFRPALEKDAEALIRRLRSAR